MADLKPQFLKTCEAEATKPLIERLYGGRYRVRRRIDAAQGLTILPKLFADYGTADEGNVTALAALADLRLVSSGLVDGDRTQADARFLQLVFETLTDTLVDEIKPVEDTDENGLKRITHQLIGLPDIDLSAYDFEVGESEHATGGLILAKLKNGSDDAATRLTVVYLEPGEVANTTSTGNNGALINQGSTWFYATPPTPAGFTLVDVQNTNTQGYPTKAYRFAKGNGQISYDPSSSNNGKLLKVTIRHLTAPGASNPIGTPSGYTLTEGPSFQQADGHLIWSASFAKGEGRVSIKESARQKGQVKIVTVTYLGTDDGATPSGVLIDTDTTQRDGHTLVSQSYAQIIGDGYVADTVQRKNKGKLVLYRRVRVGSIPEAPTATIGGTVILTDSSSKEEDGYTVYDYQWAEGKGRISITENVVALDRVTLRTVRYLETDDEAAPAGTVVETNSQQQEGVTLYEKTYLEVAGDGIILNQRDLRNKGKLALYTLTRIGSAPDAPAATIGGTVVSLGASTRREKYYTAYTGQWAEGEGVVSTDTRDHLDGAITYTTKRAYGTASAATGEFETIVNEDDGYTVYVSRGITINTADLPDEVDTLLSGAIVITTKRKINSAPTGTGSSLGTSADLRDGYTLYTGKFVVATTGAVKTTTGAGPVPGTTEMTVEAVGAEVVPTGELTLSSDIIENGYTRYIRRCVQGTIVGFKQPFADTVDVPVPGVVALTTTSITAGPLTGTIAVASVTPPRTKTVTATVTIEITTAPPTTATPAFDIGAISCSVSATESSYEYHGFDMGQTKDGSVTMTYPKRGAKVGASIQHYPGCYVTGGSATGSFSFASGAQYALSSGGSVLSEILATTYKTNTLTGSGATAATGYAASGVIKRRSREVFSTLAGVTYYEVITWTV